MLPCKQFIDTPWTIDMEHNNGGSVQMIFPFQFGDFLGSSRSFSGVYVD